MGKPMIIFSNQVWWSRVTIGHAKYAFLSVARRLRAKFWPDCAIPDTSMKFGTVVDHD